MKLLHFQSPGQAPCLGLHTSQGVIDLAQAAIALDQRPFWPLTLATLLQDAPNNLAALRAWLEHVQATLAADSSPTWLLSADDLRILPAVLAPQKIICVGKNYAAHATEMGDAPPPTPILFAKFSNALAAHGATITLPPNGEEYDYEGELAVIIGRTAQNVPPTQALDYVFGYANANDLSCRTWQYRTSQWMLGKSLDGFFPLGPYLVTADEADDPTQMNVRCWVNGQLRQDGHTSQMSFSVAVLVSYISQHMTLSPGDVISTGTPAGVAKGMAHPQWLQAGDQVEVEVGNLGRLAFWLS